MNYDLIDKIIAKYPMNLVQEDGSTVTFTTLPSYDDIAALCKNNRQVIVDADDVTSFDVGQNTLLTSLGAYIEYLTDEGVLSPRLSAVLDDLADSIEAYYTADTQSFLENAIDHVGEEPFALATLYNDLVQKGRPFFTEDPESTAAEIYTDMIEQMQDSYAFLEPDAEAEAVEYDPDEEESFGDLLQIAHDNMEEDTPVVNLELAGGDVIALPLNEEGLKLGVDMFPVIPCDLAELIEFFDPKAGEPIGTGLLPYLIAEQMQKNAHNEAFVAELEAANNFVSDLYAQQIFEMVYEFYENASINEALEARATLMEWIEYLMQEQPEDIPEAEVFVLANIHGELHEQIESEEMAHEASKVMAAKEQRHDKSVFLGVQPLSGPYLH